MSGLFLSISKLGFSVTGIPKKTVSVFRIDDTDTGTDGSVLA